ncbi:Protein of unknown function DUF115 [Lachnospiraceae bacterium XBB2008]|nr:Protein of unknown function DUF115 [Lachnospiraceae bacterium XBB2008]
MNRKLVIWGAGERGKRLIPHIRQYVDAIIDTDVNKQGTILYGVPIIDYLQFKREYYEDYIVITYSHEQEIIEYLENDGNSRYFCMSDLPGEFQESYPRNNLVSYIQGLIKEGDQFVVQGFDLYAFLVNELHREIKGQYAEMIPQSLIGEETLNTRMRDYSEYPVISRDDIRDIDINVLITHEEEIENYLDVEHINIYDCSSSITEYFNKDLERYKGIHEGKRCFVVATGPSLMVEDLNQLNEKNEICISMNSIFRVFSESKWRPQYYIAEDFRILRDYKDIIYHLDVPNVFLGDTSEESFKAASCDNIYWHHFHYEYTERRKPKFSPDFSRKCYMGATVTYSCIQLAAYLGFKRVYLMGVDFSYAHGNIGEAYKHFYEEGKPSGIAYPEAVELAYLSAKEYADQNGIEIYNATRGGCLEIFPRANFDSLFE